ncbi:hypothetical protein XELAEV_18030996mg [Xenopus laevis]|uniref:Uncharacterized protein n=1 Tax=Xenopus laevis TaxID=8355 RepID=A0A974CLU3_XENLA|nr:hypothetical protein XELAEV_18030996mg [Xenopus laevis]
MQQLASLAFLLDLTGGKASIHFNPHYLMKRDLIRYLKCSLAQCTVFLWRIVPLKLQTDHLSFIVKI